MAQYRVSGVLFKNTGNGPAFTGEIEIEGVKYPLAIWEKTSAKGNTYYQISEDKRPGTKQHGAGAQQGSPYAPRQPAAQQPQARNKDMDDEIPF